MKTPEGGLGDNWLSWERSFKDPTVRILHREGRVCCFLKKIFFFLHTTMLKTLKKTRLRGNVRQPSLSNSIFEKL